MITAIMASTLTTDLRLRAPRHVQASSWTSSESSSPAWPSRWSSPWPPRIAVAVLLIPVLSSHYFALVDPRAEAPAGVLPADRSTTVIGAASSRAWTRATAAG
ncbi:MAG: hypothetical protein MZV70_69565 [Desulfobacterales bacterium]|nr:hypothetical protein [Desulfobacterales bacterium]